MLWHVGVIFCCESSRAVCFGWIARSPMATVQPQFCRPCCTSKVAPPPAGLALPGASLADSLGPYGFNGVSCVARKLPSKKSTKLNVLESRHGCHAVRTVRTWCREPIFTGPKTIRRASKCTVIGPHIWLFVTSDPCFRCDFCAAGGSRSQFSLRGLPPLRPRPEAPAARRGLGTGEARKK